MKAFLFLLIFLLFPTTLSAKVYLTSHFRIFYDTGKTTQTYAQEVGNFLEKAFSQVSAMGYSRPEWMNKYYVDVYIKGLKAGVLGFSIHPSKGGDWLRLNLSDNDWMEINLSKNISSDDLLAATCAHEFFHIIQKGYSTEELSWLYEATAVWIEDEIFKPTGKARNQYGYLYYMGDWVRYNKLGIPLTMDYKNMKYAASFFLKYLTEKNPGNLDIIRKIWEEAKRGKGENSFEALSKALGDSNKWGDKTRKYLGEFTVTNLVRSPTFHPRYGMKDLKGWGSIKNYPEIKGPFQPLSPESVKTMKSAVFLRQSPPFIVADGVSLFSLVPNYVEIVPSKDVKKLPGKLEVATYSPKNTSYQIYLIEIPKTGQWKIRKFPDTGSGAWSSLEVVNYPASGRVIVAAMETTLSSADRKKFNGVFNPSSYKIAALLANPPFVDSMTIKQGNQTVWKVSRSDQGGARFSTSVDADKGIRFDPADTISVEIKINHPMNRIPILHLGGIKVELHRKTPESKNEFMGSLLINKLSSHLEAESPIADLSVTVDGTDILGSHFDQKPETSPHLKLDADDASIKGWEGGGVSAFGGKDTLNEKKISLVSIAPFLREVTVLQNGNVVYNAIWKAATANSRVLSLNIKKQENYDPNIRGDIRLRFDRPLKSVHVTIAGEDLDVTRNNALERHFRDELAKTSSVSMDVLETRTGAIYQGSVPAYKSISDRLKNRGEAVIKVEGKTSTGVLLDANPTRVAYYDHAAPQWQQYEERFDGPPSQIGGPDLWHKLRGTISSDGWTEIIDSSGERHAIQMRWEGDKLFASVNFGGEWFRFEGQQPSHGQVFLSYVFKNDADLRRWPFKEPSLDDLLEAKENFLKTTSIPVYDAKGGVKYQNTHKDITFGMQYQLNGSKGYDVWSGLFTAPLMKIDDDPLMPNSSGKVYYVTWRKGGEIPPAASTEHSSEMGAEAEQWIVKLNKFDVERGEADVKALKNQNTLEMEMHRDGKGGVNALVEIQGKKYEFHGEFSKAMPTNKFSPDLMMLRSNTNIENISDWLSEEEMAREKKNWSYSLIFNLNGFLSSGVLAGVFSVVESRLDNNGKVIESYPLSGASRDASLSRK